jgi:hypothetical protein
VPVVPLSDTPTVFCVTRQYAKRSVAPIAIA